MQKHSLKLQKLHIQNYDRFMSVKIQATAFFQTLQDEITSLLEALDGGAIFHEDEWRRSEGGGGRTRVLTEGNIFEKAGVNFSAVHGDSPKMLQDKLNTPSQYFATGVSLVLHPRSPKIPTVHANFRYFEKSTGESWFGGGMDLTPYYIVEDDAKHFHQTIKATCDRYELSYYPRFKQWCDEYFFIKHRGETRGIGGVFFDHLSGKDVELEKSFSFVQDLGKTFLPSYIPLVEKHKNESYTENERNWQLLRHGRYVEFNLVYDKGTLFGLETGGRIESILMSLPTIARWDYDHQPESGSEEQKLINVLKNPRDWV